MNDIYFCILVVPMRVLFYCLSIVSHVLVELINQKSQWQSNSDFVSEYQLYVCILMATQLKEKKSKLSQKNKDVLLLLCFFPNEHQTCLIFSSRYYFFFHLFTCYLLTRIFLVVAGKIIQNKIVADPYHKNLRI